MWGRGRSAWLFFWGLGLVSAGLAGCGGRATRDLEGGQGGASGGAGSAGAGHAGAGSLLRPCGSSTIPLSSLSSACGFFLDDVPSERLLEPDLVTFRLLDGGGNSVLLERREPGACEQGWQLSEDGRSVTLCEGTCSLLRQSSEASLEIMLACDGPPPRN
jgi:hypothetical protein